jgi:hypothetical protein
MGSSTGDINPESRVPLIERMPTDDTTRSKEWTTRGNRIEPEASAIVNNVDYDQSVIKRNVEKVILNFIQNQVHPCAKKAI